MHQVSPSPFAVRRHFWRCQQRSPLLRAFLIWTGMLAPLLLASPKNVTAQYQQPNLTTLNSSELGMQLTWPEELIRLPEQESPALGTLLVLRHRSKPFPTVNLLRIPGRFDLARAAETVADSYRSVGLTDAQVVRAETLPQGWAELELSYRGSAGPSTSYVLVLPRAESHAVLTMVDTAENAKQNLPLWREIVDSVKAANSQSGAVESGFAQSVPPVWAVVLLLAIIAGVATVGWHHRRRPPSSSA
jgi:hypothetical protein